MPTPADIWGQTDPLIGTVEQPNGSNHAPPVTPWYYGWDAAWCAMYVSYCLAHGGFSDDGGETCNIGRIAGIVQTTPKGWAYCPYLRKNFEDAGRFYSEPEPGDIFITGDEGHTGFCWRVNSDGSFQTVEGNYGNMVALGRRWINDQSGFCRPPYDGVAAGPPAPAVEDYLPFPGTTRRGSRGEAVRQVQKRLVVHGHAITVDGVFGPITDARVRVHQRAWRLEVDGVVGPKTWATLRVTP